MNIYATKRRCTTETSKTLYMYSISNNTIKNILVTLEIIKHFARSFQNCHHVNERTRSMLGEGVKGCNAFFKMLFTAGSLKINIFKVCLWEGGVPKKSTLCMLLIT